MISKELLSVVLGKEIRDLDLSSTNSNKLNYLNVGDDWWYDINIHELAQRCKGWAKEQGYSMESGTEQNHQNYFVFCSKDFACISNANCFKDVCDTEPEAIFKACQWILEQKAKA